MTQYGLDMYRHNNPEELSELNDCFNTMPKGKMIIDFLKYMSEQSKQKVKMIALYGEWGSGKTSLMQWIERSLILDDKYKTVFFESWQHESDSNIALSLMDVISATNENIEQKDMRNHLYKSLGAIVKGVGKSLTVDIFPGIKFNGEKLIQEVENYNKILDETTFYEKICEFKKAYQELEDSILGKNNDKQLIVFIDDLDRCEHENVLTLLSVIKLFFSYGKRTIFICGLDKESVNKSVFHKYNDVVKGNEYLEKIFDISFSMPKCNISKIIEYYLLELNSNEKGIVKDFFYAINFTNPRRIKKVFNKFIVLKSFRGHDENYKLIPDLKIELYRILVLFIIILYEFETDNYYVVREYDAKIAKYADVIKDKDHTTSISIITNSLIRNLRLSIVDMMENNKQFPSAFCTIFSPNLEEYQPIIDVSEENYYKQFEKGKCILSKFCVYIYGYSRRLRKEDFLTDKYKFINLFEMAELYL